MTKRLVFLGTPAIAVPPLRALRDAGHEITLVVSQPDRRRGRGTATAPSPVKAAAVELGLPTSDRVDDVVASGAELGVVVAFGRLIKPHVLAAVPMVNMHFSLLPRWRGAAPVERAILAGDPVTGVCIMDVVDELDAGGIYACAEVPIGDATAAEELRDRLGTVGTDLLLDVVAGELPPPRPQHGDVTYAEKLRPEEWRLDWTLPAVKLHRWVLAGQAWTTFRGKRLRVLSADLGNPGEDGEVGVGTSAAPGTLRDAGAVTTGGGVLRVLRVQPEGKPAMSWRDFANGARPQVGELLG